jgi:hypothetical protein
MIRATFAASVLGLFGASMACGGAAPADSTSADENLTSAQLAGYYELTGQHGDFWIEQLALHPDGSFEANMGTDESNVSGHHFPTTGTFDVKSQGGTELLSLRAIGINAGDSTYDVVVTGDKLEFKDHGAPGGASFRLHKTELATITFNADWSITPSGPIVADAPFLVRYAASRDDCPPPEGGGLALEAFGEIGGITASITQPFNSQPVKGFLSAFGSVSSQGATDLAVWFKGGAQDAHEVSTGCTHWDSNLGKNYHFTVTAR